MSHLLRPAAALLSAVVLSGCAAIGAAPAPGRFPHPLDPLSADEIAAVTAVLRAAGKAGDDTRCA
jgi:Cu2+-containing amine oxidase